MVFEPLQQALDQQQEAGLLRRRRLLESAQGVRIRVDGQQVLSFCSNNYLGLSNHPAIIEAARTALHSDGVGAGASHLVTGHHQRHAELEAALAAFVDLPRALLFSSGYMANIGVVTALVGRDDAIFADKLNHASLNDAMVLSRAGIKRYAHNNMAQLEKLLKNTTARRKLVITDAVFSMDGDLAPIADMLLLCDRYDAWLLLDDAHGFGVLGAQGRGVLQHFGLSSPRIIYMATLGKAAGVAGAFVAGDATLIAYLVQHARSYIYTTASPPLLAGALLQSLKIIAQDQARRTHLQTLIAALHSGLRTQRWHLMASHTPIQPLVIGSNEEALRLSARLLEEGLLVPAIRPPTVPVNTARLRISLSAAHALEDVARLAQALNRLEQA